MNPDPSLFRLIANPHRLKKEIPKVPLQKKGREYITRYIRNEYNHIYITPALLSGIDSLVRDYIADYEVERVCDDIIKSVIQITIRDASTVIGFDPVETPENKAENNCGDSEDFEDSEDIIDDSYESSNYDTDADD